MLSQELNASAGRDCGLRDQKCVDVIIAAWNCEKTIERAVASALAQNEVHRVIVVDDASTDGTKDRVHAADDGSGRLTVFEFPENRGPAAARNKALSLCQAPWIAVLDGDDYFLPGRFSRLLALADDWDFIADNLLQISEDHAQVDVLLPAGGKEPFEPYRCDFETFIRGNISRPGCDRKELGFLQPLMRRVFLMENALRYDENLRFGEDYAFCAHALALGARFLVIPALGYAAVIQSRSLSNSASKTHFERLRNIDLVLGALDRLTVTERAAVKAHSRSVEAIIQWLEVIEAVKDRSAVRFLIAYGRSFHTAKYISARLSEQIVQRFYGKIKRMVQFAGVGGTVDGIPVTWVEP